MEISLLPGMNQSQPRSGTASISAISNRFRNCFNIGMSHQRTKHKNCSRTPPRVSRSDPSSCWCGVGRFNYPSDVSLGPNGTLFVVDLNSLRRVSMPEFPTTVLGVGFDGRVSTVAGGAGPGETDGTGPEVNALIALSLRLSPFVHGRTRPLTPSTSRQLPPPPSWSYETHMARTPPL